MENYQSLSIEVVEKDLKSTGILNYDPLIPE